MSGQEIYSYHSRSSRLSFSGGELKIKEADSSTGYAVRVLSDGRIGFGYCQQEKDIGKTLEDAKKLSRFCVKSGFSFVPKSKFNMPQIHDPTLDPENVTALRAFVDEARESASSKGGKPRIISFIESDQVKLENSEGFSGEYKKTTFSLFIECMHGDGYGMSYLAQNKWPKSVEEQGNEAAEMAKSMQGAAKPESGSYTAVFELEALESLIETLIPSFSGDWKRRKMTRLKAGEKFSQNLTICEDGMAPGIDARPFDDEGTPSEKNYLIRDGSVHSFLYDRETAALEKVERSGSCSRESYDTPPVIGPSNIVVSPGEMKDLGELDRFIEVHYAHGSHTANLTSGDIGLEVSAAFLVNKGERRPIKGFMMSGNIFDLFSKIEAIEKKQKAYGSLISPRIAFRDVQVIS